MMRAIQCSFGLFKKLAALFGLVLDYAGWFGGVWSVIVLIDGVVRIWSGSQTISHTHPRSLHELCSSLSSPKSIPC
jgi:hypothetical protein